MALRITLTLLLMLVTLPITFHRVFWLTKLIRSGAAAPGRSGGAGQRVTNDVEEVLGQKRLLKWGVSGVAHFFTFWGFMVLALTILEAFGALLITPDFHIPLVGKWQVLGFLEDFFATATLATLVVFATLRIRQAPARRQRDSRFYGSHNNAAWIILIMIALVVLSLFGLRGAQLNAGQFPFGDSKWAFASYGTAKLFGQGAYNEGLATFMLLAQVVVVMAFLVLVVYSKHLHIGLAAINVYFKRLPGPLGALLPVADRAGQTIDFMDAENLSEDTVFGKGKIDDFTWKGYLDFATCTECGRCQSQCPAWNTGKPLSPKLLIMDLRDHMFAKAPYLIGGKTVPDGATPNFPTPGVEGAEHGHHVPEAGYPRVIGPGLEQATRPLVGDAASYGVIDPDVLWSCTTCGACVEQCPVDIEHIDHIVDMRRYQVLIESSFPSEAGTMLRNLENKGNPWGLPTRNREEWTEGLGFDVRRVSPGQPLPAEVEYLFWVGCAGSLEDSAKKVTRSFAQLLDVAGVEFAILGAKETCTGDSARRLGNEFVFQMLGAENVEILNSIKPEGGALKIVATCPHCFNTIANEYPQLGGEYEVVHHTELLAKLIAEGRLTPVEPVDKKVTYHDPCYLGRHNKIYTPPREVLGAIPALKSQEMHRCKDRGFCCGAGGARFWMEETIGKRINVDRTEEALGLDPDLISTACPFCMVMLADAVTTKQSDGSAKDHVQVLDVAQILQQSLRAPVVQAPS